MTEAETNVKVEIRLENFKFNYLIILICILIENIAKAQLYRSITETQGIGMFVCYRAFVNQNGHTAAGDGSFSSC